MRALVHPISSLKLTQRCFVSPSRGHQWEPLCRFLEVDVPDTPFPHANNEAALNAFIGAKVKQGILRWLVVLTAMAAAGIAYKRTR